MSKSQSAIKLSSALSQDIMKNCVNYMRTDVIVVDCHCQKGVPQGSTRDPVFFNFLFRQNKMQTGITMNYVDVQSKNKNSRPLNQKAFSFISFF